MYNYFGCNFLQSIIPHFSEFLVLIHIIHRVIVSVKRDVKLIDFGTFLPILIIAVYVWNVTMYQRSVIDGWGVMVMGRPSCNMEIIVLSCIILFAPSKLWLKVCCYLLLWWRSWLENHVLKMWNTTQRECGQPQLFSLSFEGHRMPPLVHIIERFQCLWTTVLLIC